MFICIMEGFYFDDNLSKTTKLVICPNCDNELRTAVEEYEILCDECGEKFSLEQEGYPEEFVWCPGEKY